MLIWDIGKGSYSLIIWCRLDSDATEDFRKIYGFVVSIYIPSFWMVWFYGFIRKITFRIFHRDAYARNRGSLASPPRFPLDSHRDVIALAHSHGGPLPPRRPPTTPRPSSPPSRCCPITSADSVPGSFLFSVCPYRITLACRFPLWVHVFVQSQRIDLMIIHTCKCTHTDSHIHMYMYTYKYTYR